MPQKLRTALTLPDDLRDALADLAEVMGKPITAVTVDLLVEILPQIQGMVKLNRAIKSGNKATAKRALVEMVGKEMADVMSSQQKELFKAKRSRK